MSVEKWLGGLVGCLVLLLAACVPGHEVGEPVGAAAAAVTGVTWFDVAGASVNANSLTKTGAAGWNAGAASNEILGGDGYVEFTTAEATTDKLAGLSHADPVHDPGAIDFGLYLSSGGGVNVYEDGVFAGTFGTYAAGDVFRIQVSGTKVTYLRNGNLLFTSSKTPSLPLLLGVALYSPSATVNNAVIDPPYWQDAVGVATTGRSLTKTGASGWNAGAATTASLLGDGYVQLTTAEANTDKVAGLSHADPAQNYAAIDFGFYLSSSGGANIYEDGVSVYPPLGTSSLYAAGDVLGIQVSGAQVTYLKNGVALYRSTKTPTSPLLFGAVLYTTGATIDNVVLAASSTLWQDAVGVAASGPSLTKTGASGWNAGAATTETLSGSGAVQLTTAEATTDKIAGLAHADPAGNPGAVDFGLYLSSAGEVNVYEDGVLAGTFGTYAAGDLFQIQVTGTKVTYLQNGTLLYTSARTPTLPLLFGAALYTNGATVNNVGFSTYWQDAVGVHASGESLTKTGAAGWNAGAATTETLSGSGAVQFTTAEATTDKIAGLAHADPARSFSAIDFGLYLSSGGEVNVYEDGVLAGTFGTYAAGDAFRIQVSGTQVTYLQNGTLLYTSTRTPTLPLLFAASLYTPSATVDNVVVGNVGGALVAGSAVGSVAVRSDGTVWSVGDVPGDGTSNDPLSAEQVLSSAVAVTASNTQSLVLLANGTVQGWAENNNDGQLGDGNTMLATSPVQVSGLTGVSAISTSGNTSLAVKSDGTAWGWGDNDEGQIGDGTTSPHLTPVQVVGLTRVARIAAGGEHSLAAKADGTVWAWGENTYGELGNGTTTGSPSPVQVPGLTGVSAVAAGGLHSLALSGGTVWAWGGNFNGEVGNGTTQQQLTPVAVGGLAGNVIAIAAGQQHSLALRWDGTVWAWGANGSGQLGDGTSVSSPRPVQVVGLTGVIAIGASDTHSLAVKSDGTVWAWGYNNWGQLGDGTKTPRPTPVQSSL